MEEIIRMFLELGIRLDSDWLAGVELVHETCLTVDDVYTALMASDLRQSCASTGSVISRDKSCVSEGSWLFQITSYRDISIPNTHCTKSSKRMLKLEMHCGSVCLHAIELVACSELPDEPDGGTKLIIKGSPRVHKGIVLLMPQHIQIIGGHVTELIMEQKLIKEKKNRDPLTYR